MLTVRETVGAISVVVGAAVLAAVNHHPSHGRRPARERAAVQAVADRLSRRQIADAWTQMKLANPTPLRAIQSAVPLPARSVYEDGPAIVLVFEGHEGTCVDLISRLVGNTVETRRC